MGLTWRYPNLCLDTLPEIASEAISIQIAYLTECSFTIEVMLGGLHWEASESTPGDRHLPGLRSEASEASVITFQI